MGHLQLSHLRGGEELLVSNGDAARHAAVHRYIPTINNFSASAGAEEPWNKEIKVSLFILL